VNGGSAEKVEICWSLPALVGAGGAHAARQVLQCRNYRSAFCCAGQVPVGTACDVPNIILGFIKAVCSPVHHGTHPSQRTSQSTSDDCRPALCRAASKTWCNLQGFAGRADGVGLCATSLMALVGKGTPDSSRRARASTWRASQQL
jgi:hypothetical protein